MGVPVPSTGSVTEDVAVDGGGYLTANGDINFWLGSDTGAWTPGTFTGTLENGVVTALYTYSSEGETAKQEILFKLAEGGLRIGNGELVQDQGVWLFKDKGQAEYGDAIPEVPCN